MPGFIGVRWGELVPVELPVTVADVFMLFGSPSPVRVGQVDNTIIDRTDPDERDKEILWSFFDVLTVSVMTAGEGDDEPKVWSSSNGGKTWQEQATTTRVLFALKADEVYGVSPTATVIRKSVTGGTTWTDLIPVPSGRSGFSDIKATATHIYALTEPQE